MTDDDFAKYAARHAYGTDERPRQDINRETGQTRQQEWADAGINSEAEASEFISELRNSPDTPAGAALEQDDLWDQESSPLTRQEAHEVWRHASEKTMQHAEASNMETYVVDAKHDAVFRGTELPTALSNNHIETINPARLSVAQASQKPTYEADTRFIATDPTPGPGGGSAGNAARMGSLQAAYWRAEDLTRSYRTEGNDLCPALTPADMIHMGRWHAFAQIQRAGAVRQDIIQVQHDYS